ncbi:portal protein [Methylocystis sp. S23]
MSGNLLDVNDLVLMFEDSEEATSDARKLSERDRDYYDGDQLTSAELAALSKRRQPPVIINRIKRKVDYLRGFEQSQRVNPRALPRTPQHDDDASSIEQALRFVCDEENFDYKRSDVFENLVIEGMGGYAIGVMEHARGVDITIDRVPWDRMFYDPHSRERDFSDARYLGLVRWEDYSEALAQYPGSEEILDATLNSVSISDTYDDKPEYRIWADKRRKRVRICQIWVKRGDSWNFAEFTKGGILVAGPSPYLTDDGESDCGLIYGSAYVSRDNERYGIVREMISPQDEINKRRSKALHRLSTTQMVFERGAFQDPERARTQAARPDGQIELNPGHFEKFKFETRTDLAAADMQMLQEAKNEIDMMAGNIALQGNALQKTAASGRAIIASQQGGAMEIAPIMDSLRSLDIRVFRAVWYRIRQFWTAEKWIRITDDERNVRWLGLNVDPMQVQMAAAQNPQLAEKIAGVIGNIAELDCDIIIEDAPDGLTPQMEQFQSLVELKKMDANGELPFRAIVAAMPNLRNREQVLAAMDQGKQPSPEAAQMQQASMQLQFAGAKAKVDEAQASAQLKQAQAIKAMSEARATVPQMQGEEGPSLFDQHIQASESRAKIEDTLASADLKRASTAKIMQDIALAPQKMARENMQRGL